MIKTRSGLAALSLLAILVTGSPPTDAQTPVPLTLTGWDANVIGYSPGKTSPNYVYPGTGIDNGPTGFVYGGATPASVDVTVNTYTQSTLFTPLAGDGKPYMYIPGKSSTAYGTSTSGLNTSMNAGDPDAIVLAGPSGVSGTGSGNTTLTMANAINEDHLYVFATTGNGTTSGSGMYGTVKVNYVNGDSLTANYWAPDWNDCNCSGGPASPGTGYYAAFGSYGSTKHENANGGADYYWIYGTSINLSSMTTVGGANASTLPIQSFTFTSAGTAYHTAIFDISATGFTPSPNGLLVAGAGMSTIMAALQGRRRKRLISPAQPAETGMAD